jgi:crossover junction endodeoxyribonuclease RuvC
MSKSIQVLGIDPGSHFTGYGLVRTDGLKIEILSYGVIVPPAQASFNERIGVIAAEFEILLERICPEVTVIERIFLGKNADSAFKLGHARGVIVASAMRAGSNVVEYATRKVKKGITGNGAASKEQVQMVLVAGFGLTGPLQIDASDALALAVYHSRNMEIARALELRSRKQPGSRGTGMEA